MSNPGHKLFLQRHGCLPGHKDDPEVFLKIFRRNLEGKRRDIMKNIPFYKTINGGLSHFRLAAVGVLLLGAAALAAIAVNPSPPKLPWRVPTVDVGINPVISVVDQATHTV